MASLGRVELATAEVVAHIPRCCDCRWWDDDDGIMPDGPNAPTWGECERFKPWNKDGQRAHAYGDMMTAPDFGCVQWEARE